jgi:hypothetical protein
MSDVDEIAHISAENYAILIRLSKISRRDALPERVIKRIVDGGRRDPEASGCPAVYRHFELLAVQL